MNLEQRQIPSVSEYVAAFRAIESQIDEGQRALLREHHAAPARATSATRLAEAVGFENYNAVNLRYGLMAEALCKALGIDLEENVRVGIVVDFVDPGFAANNHFLWVMRHNAVQALEELGWVPRNSHLLYPKGA
jgi:hypothetical protein